MSPTPPFIITQCPACYQRTVLWFVNHQEGYEDLPGFDLYNCSSCHSTVSSTRLHQQRQAQPSPARDPTLAGAD